MPHCYVALSLLRQIDKNKLLVEELSAYLPERRSELSAGVVRVSALLAFSMVHRACERVMGQPQ